MGRLNELKPTKCLTHYLVHDEHCYYPCLYYGYYSFKGREVVRFFRGERAEVRLGFLYRQEGWPRLRAGKAAGVGWVWEVCSCSPRPGDKSRCRAEVLAVPAPSEDLKMPNDMQMSLSADWVLSVNPSKFSKPEHKLVDLIRLPSQ